MDVTGDASSANDDVVVVVMGVSGCGKSSVAKRISRATGWEFAEGDDFHSEASVAKMHAGEPLTDDDRRPWLEAIAEWISAKQSRGESAVITCSALKRGYRDRLRRGCPAVRFLHVDVPGQLLRHRLENRHGHYMPADLLASQLKSLEPLEADEPGTTIVGLGTEEAVLARALAALGRA